MTKKKEQEHPTIALKWTCQDCGRENETNHKLVDSTLHEDMAVFAGCLGNCHGTKTVRIQVTAEKRRIELEESKALPIMKQTKNMYTSLRVVVPETEMKTLDSIIYKLENGGSIENLNYVELEYLHHHYMGVYRK
jgi:hypothetical protein